ncbi:MAG: alpha/beta hydrolase family protein, partial [Vicinamibacteraceae bacterium]
MPSRVLILLAATLVVGSAAHAPREAHAAQDATPAARFDRWLDVQADRALANGARARGKALNVAGTQRRATTEIQRRSLEVRRQVLEAMGGLPAERAPLNARITGRLDRGDYRIEHLVFESLPGFFVTANLYVPTTGSGPFPAVLGTAGHADEGKASPTYQHVWASLARRGIIVLAYDPPGQGERLEYLDPAIGTSRVGIGTREHSHAGQQCLLTGTSIARYFAWDGVRAIDYLLTRAEVDPKRLGVAGNSGGGTQTAWLAVVEERLSAIDASCYVTSWAALWKGPGPQDMEQVLPGFLARGLDFVDLIIAAQPRPYLVSSAIQDFFPIEGARATVADARRAYQAIDAADRVGHVEHDDKHGWSQPLREAAYAWFDKWWRGGAGGTTAVEGDVTIEPV